jgi:hypothetical protein
MKDWSAILKGIGVGVAAGVVTGLIGFFFAKANSPGMGYLMFLLVPVAAGFAVALVTRRPNTSVAAGWIAILPTLVILIATRLEGLLCALMALPWLAIGVAIGALLGRAVRRGREPEGSPNASPGKLLVVIPLVLVAAKRIETPIVDQTRVEAVSTTVWVADTPEHTWMNIQSIDSIHSAKPWLMHVGLPVPQRCSLEKAGVGARRTCYFDQGYIEETVTEWDPPRSMQLRIDRTHMPGRHWLGFENATYQLEPEGKGTRLTRTTVISSHLYPAWYWRPLERWGVESEHNYLLEDVARRARGW